jgi:hypothetical protein
MIVAPLIICNRTGVKVEIKKPALKNVHPAKCAGSTVVTVGGSAARLAVFVTLTANAVGVDGSGLLPLFQQRGRAAFAIAGETPALGSFCAMALLL